MLEFAKTLEDEGRIRVIGSGDGGIAVVSYDGFKVFVSDVHQLSVVANVEEPYPEDIMLSVWMLVAEYVLGEKHAPLASDKTMRFLFDLMRALVTMPMEAPFVHCCGEILNTYYRYIPLSLTKRAVHPVLPNTRASFAAATIVAVYKLYHTERYREPLSREYIGIGNMGHCVITALHAEKMLGKKITIPPGLPEALGWIDPALAVAYEALLEDRWEAFREAVDAGMDADYLLFTLMKLDEDRVDKALLALGPNVQAASLLARLGILDRYDWYVEQLYREIAKRSGLDYRLEEVGQKYARGDVGGVEVEVAESCVVVAGTPIGRLDDAARLVSGFARLASIV